MKNIRDKYDLRNWIVNRQLVMLTKNILFVFLLGDSFLATKHLEAATLESQSSGLHPQQIAIGQSFIARQINGIRTSTRVVDPISASKSQEIQDLFGIAVSADKMAAAMSGISVIENALGDLNEDSTLDILDLLRLRDIVKETGSTATPYELGEGDLNGNHMIDTTDLRMEGDVLLRKMGVPHVIGLNGGEVMGNGGRTSFFINEGTFDGPRIICVEDYDRQAFIQDFHFDIGDLGIGSYLMAGAKLVIMNPEPEDSLLMNGIEMSEQIPEGMVPDTNGNNGFFVIKPDQTADGVPDIDFLGDLSTNSDTSAMLFTYAPQIHIDSVRRTHLDPVTGDYSLENNPDFESGMKLLLFGTGWESSFSADYEIQWVIDNDTLRTPVNRTVTVNGSSYKDAIGVMVSVPEIATSTTAQVELNCIPAGTVSNIVEFVINPPSINTSPALRDSLSLVFHKLDTLFSVLSTDSLVEVISVGQGFSFSDFLDAFRLKIKEFDSVPDTELDMEELGRQYQLFKNSEFDEAFDELTMSEASDKRSVYSLRCRTQSGPSPDPACIRRCNLTWDLSEATIRIKKAECGQCGINPWCWAKCAASLPSKPLDAVLDWIKKSFMWQCLTCCCPRDYFKVCKAIDRSTLDLKTGNYETKFVCLHYRWQVLPTSLLGTWRCTEGCDEPHLLYGTCGKVFQPFPNANKSDYGSLYRGTTQSQSFAGLVVSVKDAIIPLSNATVGPNNLGLIPFNLNSGSLTFSGYYPLTGQFDPDIGSVFVTDALGTATVANLSFDPDTSLIVRNMSIPGQLTDSIRLERQRVYTRVTISDSLALQMFNLGFSSTAPLSLKIEDPNGALIYDNTITDCHFDSYFQFTKVGTYLLKVAFGQSGQPGDFTIGINDAPYPAVAFLCGEIPYDTLYSDYSPYILRQGASVVGNETLMIQAGTAIEIEPGGFLTGTGFIRGTGPFLLKPRSSGAFPTAFPARESFGASLEKSTR